MSDSRFPTSDLQECVRVDPLSELVLELPALVDQDLAVLCEHDAIALQRARRRAFEVDTGRPESAPMARALELGFGRQEVWCAAEMRARRVQHVEAARAMDDIVGRANDPDAVGLLETLVHPHAEVG